MRLGDRDHLEDLGVDEKIIFKWMSRNGRGDFGLTCLTQDRALGNTAIELGVP
jgi:hypothetical protein